MASHHNVLEPTKRDRSEHNSPILETKSHKTTEAKPVDIDFSGKAQSWFEGPEVSATLQKATALLSAEKTGQQVPHIPLSPSLVAAPSTAANPVSFLTELPPSPTDDLLRGLPAVPFAQMLSLE